MAKSALGKGIDALFGEGAENIESGDIGASVEKGISTLKISEISPAGDQPRKNFSQEALKELADSISEKGVLQPVLVHKWNDGYQIVAGERRYRAAALAGLEEIPVIITDVTEEERLEIALIENIQREDLTPIEEAEAYRHLIETLELSQDEVAKKVGKKRSTVANSLRLLKLPKEMQSALNKGIMSAGHARAILSVVNPAHQKVLFGHISDDGISVREAEQLAGEMNSGGKSADVKKGKAKKQPAKDADIKNIEQSFIDRLGTKVQLKGSLEKGTIEIAYFSKDDLERVYDLILK